MYVCMDMKVYPGKVAVREKNTGPANPWSRKIWRLIKKKSRDSHFFQIKIKQTLIPLGELIVCLKITLF